MLQFDCRLYHTKAPNDTADARVCIQFKHAPLWYADACRKNHSGEHHPGAIAPAAGGDNLNQAMPGGGPPLDEETMAMLSEEHRARFRIG